jgi:hypothetical protein
MDRTAVQQTGRSMAYDIALGFYICGVTMFTLGLLVQKVPKDQAWPFFVDLFKLVLIMAWPLVVVLNLIFWRKERT